MCNNIVKFLIFSNFIPQQITSKLKLFIHKAFLSDDLKIFKWVEDPKSLRLYSKIKSAQPKKKRKKSESSFFSLKWFRRSSKEISTKEIETEYEYSGKIHQPIENIFTEIKKFDDFSELDGIRLLEITRLSFLSQFFDYFLNV